MIEDRRNISKVNVANNHERHELTDAFVKRKERID